MQLLFRQLSRRAFSISFYRSGAWRLFFNGSLHGASGVEAKGFFGLPPDNISPREMRIKPFFIGSQRLSIDCFETNSGVINIHYPLLQQVFVQLCESNPSLFSGL